VLKVFLIDRAGFIREIYTSTFLYPKIVLNDIETLLQEETALKGASQASRPSVRKSRFAGRGRGAR
jgi:hypothetical protein